MSLSVRFFVLILFSLLLALFAGAWAMRLVAGPILTSMQQTSIEEQSLKISLLIGNMLDVRTRELELLARDTRVVSGVIGEASNMALVEDLVSQFSADVAYSRLAVFDILNEVVANKRQDTSGASSERDSIVQKIAGDVLAESDPTHQISFLQHDAELMFFVAVPVVLNGSVEGVVAGAFSSNLPVGPEFTKLARKISITDEAPPSGSGKSNIVHTPINDTGLMVLMEPDTEGLDAVRDELILTVTFALFAALAVPFGVLAYGGRLAIVVPTQRLITSENKLRQSQKQLSEFQVLVKTSNDAIIVTDGEGRIQWINTAFSQLTGFSLEEVQGRKPGPILQGEDTDPETAAKISKAISYGRSIQTQICNYRKDGTPYWVELYISPMWDENGKIYQFFAVSRNITDQLEREKQLVAAREAVEYQALHDPLTSLPNRRYVTKWLEENSGKCSTVIRVDLDHFKFVNDTLGHDAGDHVLQHVSDLLRSATGPDDVVARVGGDEFVILLGHGADGASAEALCREVLVELEKDIPFQDKLCKVGSSFGIACMGDDLLDEKDIISCADVALYLAKDSGRNTVMHYTRAVHADVLRGRTMSFELEQALDIGGFIPYYQPQYCSRHNKISGVEVLMRWDHPRLGILKPKEFLKLAEQLSLLADIERLLFNAVTADLKTFRDAGLELPKVSFNVSKDRLLDPGLIPELKGLTDAGQRVCLEVLESFLVEDEAQPAGVLKTLKESGIELAIDHFGTGHASIVGLNRLRPDSMKIDRHLILPITQDSTGRKLVQSIVDIGRNLDISITAVGVETSAHARLLSAMNVNALQGHCFCPSLPAKDFLAFCLSHDPEQSRSLSVVG